MGSKLLGSKKRSESLEPNFWNGVSGEVLALKSLVFELEWILNCVRRVSNDLGVSSKGLEN